MAHSHSHDTPVKAEDFTRRRRALRMLMVVLIPLGVWTLAGLIALWPGNISEHINENSAMQYNAPGVTYPEARITGINEVSCEGLAGSTPGVESSTCAEVTAELLDGDEKGQSVTITLTDVEHAAGTKVGQKMVLVRVPVEGGPAQYQFSDFERGTPLLVIALIFVAAVVVVARWRGFASLIGLGFAGFILVKFMFPALIEGQNPILVGLIGSAAIMFVVLYAAHGFNARTTTALVGTLFGLLLIAGLGWVGTKWAHLTGVSSEEDYVLAATATDMNLSSVVMLGIIVAGLGVLNDVTITQASAVWELADSDPDHSRLFSRAMRIGRDHIASTVYTIAFATAGAVLPVLLLIAIYERPLLQVLQTEEFAGEVIRTLIGSIGLVLAVPLTTAVGVAVVRASRYRPGGSSLPGSGKSGEAGGVPGGRRSQSTSSAGDAVTGSASTAALDDTQTSGTAVTETRIRRRRKKDEFEDFDDFSDLRDPNDPKTRRP